MGMHTSVLCESLQRTLDMGYIWIDLLWAKAQDQMPNLPATARARMHDMDRVLECLSAPSWVVSLWAAIWALTALLSLDIFAVIFSATQLLLKL